MIPMVTWVQMRGSNDPHGDPGAGVGPRLSPMGTWVQGQGSGVAQGDQGTRVEVW